MARTPPRRHQTARRSKAAGAPKNQQRNRTAELVECRSEPVSRVLCPCGRRSFIWKWTIAHRRSSDRTRGTLSGPLTLLFGLAPGGVWHARDHSRAGGLLPRHFTRATLAGGVFSVPLSAGRPAPSLAATLPYGARTFLPFLRGDRSATRPALIVARRRDARVSALVVEDTLAIGAEVDLKVLLNLVVELWRQAHPAPLVPDFASATASPPRRLKIIW